MPISNKSPKAPVSYPTITTGNASFEQLLLRLQAAGYLATWSKRWTGSAAVSTVELTYGKECRTAEADSVEGALLAAYAAYVAPGETPVELPIEVPVETPVETSSAGTERSEPVLAAVVAPALDAE